MRCSTGRGSNVGLMWCSPFGVRLMVRIVGSLCNGLIRTDSARSMKEDTFWHKEDTFGMRRPSGNAGRWQTRYVRTVQYLGACSDGSGSRYSRYIWWKKIPLRHACGSCQDAPKILKVDAWDMSWLCQIILWWQRTISNAFENDIHPAWSDFKMKADPPD